MMPTKNNEPKNCGECKFANANKTKCKKTGERITAYDWCAMGKKK